ncbi:MerR family transcriptional regulator [Antribacter gilvus]|uniref:MerR family transcriptional regulator n=1 Tax=Antribacter gilvus TaxID=2304675 RepID=UPI000F7AB72C|nr:MerR family transcriptional regulator [Antribacter gilvus]
MDWSIQEIARLTGTTSRTLRHYDAVGLLPPTRVGSGGLRYYDRDALVRLQRILLLRELGLGLGAIAGVLHAQADEKRALTTHRDWLRAEQERIGRQIASVERTITALDEEEDIMAADMLDGFDHTQYKEEVEQRWGREAYASGDAWWRRLGKEGQREWLERVKALNAEWVAGAEAGLDPASDEAQAIAAKHADWLGGVPGTPGAETARPTAEYLLGLGDLYVADPRFGANYGGGEGARFVRDTLRVYVERTY